MARHYRLKHDLVASAIVAAFSTSASSAAAAQVGDLFTVATGTAPDGAHFVSFEGPSLAGSSKGFAVGWTTIYSDTSGAPSATTLSLYTTSATPIAANIALGKGLYYEPGVAMDADGDVAVAWTQPVLNDGWLLNGALNVKRYSAAGVEQGKTIRIATTYDYILPFYFFGFSEVQKQSSAPLIAMDDAGDFTVGWSEDGYTIVGCTQQRPIGCLWGGGHIRTYLASYRANGSANKWKTRIDPAARGTEEPNDAGLAGLAMLNDGHIEALVGDVKAGFTGTPTLNLFNQYILPIASVALQEVSAYAVAFDSSGNVYQLHDSTVTRYAPDGSVLSPDIVVIPNSSYIYSSAIAVAPSGRFAVVWSAGSGELDAQYVDANGMLQGNAFVVQPSVSNGGTFPNISAWKAVLDDSGKLVVVWNGASTDGAAIAGRVVSGP